MLSADHLPRGYERGEVALLTRNIRLQASADAEQSFYGGEREGDWREQDVCRGRRVLASGPEPDSCPVSDPLASGRRCQRACPSDAAVPRHLNRCVIGRHVSPALSQNNVTYNTVGHCSLLGTAWSTATSMFTTGYSDSSLNVSRVSHQPRRESSRPESVTQWPAIRRMTCCPRTTRREALDSSPGHVYRTTWRLVPIRPVLDVIAGASER